MAFIHRKIRPFVTLMRDGKDIRELGIEVLHVRVSHALEETPGSFSIRLVPRMELGGELGKSSSIVAAYRMLEPGDLLSIGFERPHAAMLGRIDTIGKERTPVGDKLTKTVTISGTELGGDLVADGYRNIPAENGSISLNLVDAVKKRLSELLKDSHGEPAVESFLRNTPLRETVEEAKETLDKAKTLLIGDFISAALKRLPSLQISVGYLGRSTKLGDLIRIRSQVPSFGDEVILRTASRTHQGNSLLQHIRESLDTEFYEVFWDTLTDDDGMPYVKLDVRARPFDRLDDPIVDPLDGRIKTVRDSEVYKKEKSFVWENLRTATDPEKERHVIGDDQVLSLSLQVSAERVYSAYTTASEEGTVLDSPHYQVGTGRPLLDMLQLNRFGYRELPLRTRQVVDRPEFLRDETVDAYRQVKERLSTLSKEGIDALPGDVVKTARSVLSSTESIVSDLPVGSAEAKEAVLNFVSGVNGVVDTVDSAVATAAGNVESAVSGIEESIRTASEELVGRLVSVLDEYLEEGDRRIGEFEQLLNAGFEEIRAVVFAVLEGAEEARRISEKIDTVEADIESFLETRVAGELPSSVRQSIRGTTSTVLGTLNRALSGVAGIVNLAAGSLSELLDTAERAVIANLRSLRAGNKAVITSVKNRAERLILWKQHRMYNWNRLNRYFESGTISIIGREAIHVGERVMLVDERARDGSMGLEGYITEVTHTWGYDGIFETSLRIERCITEETRLGIARRSNRVESRQ